MDKIHVIYGSTTGMTEAVAAKIADALGAQVFNVNADGPPAGVWFLIEKKGASRKIVGQRQPGICRAVGSKDERGMMNDENRMGFAHTHL